MRHIYLCLGEERLAEDPAECKSGAKLLLDGARRARLSKLMSGLLRHFPGEVGLTLDKEGWVPIDELVRAVKERWRNREAYTWLRPEHVLAVATLDPKGRFEVRGRRIRARYGHSIPVEIEYEEDRESKVLYHGTTERSYKNILREGVKPGRRLWVHLSTTLKDAVETGRRHGGRVVVLVVDADCLRKRGFRIYKASDRVRLVKHVPSECITRSISTTS